MKKNVCLLLLLSLSLSLFCACTEDEAPGETTPETVPVKGTEAITVPATDAPETEDPGEKYYLEYCVFGDSIAYGYGLADSMNERFSALLQAKMSAVHPVNVYNYGVNGDDSTDMLNLLREGKATELAGADLISISIGANNLLGVVAPYFEQIAQGDTAALLPVISSKEFNDELSAGVERLGNDIPELIKEIRKEAPDAEIVWQTVYNPFVGVRFATGMEMMPLFDLGAFTETYLAALNAKIIALSVENGYSVCDIYTAFKNSEAHNVNVTVDETGFPTNIDPHPNAAGHELIAKTLLASFGKAEVYADKAE